MYKIEKKPYGFKLTFGGFIRNDEMQQWVEESKKALEKSPSKFGVFIDMRELKPLPSSSQEYMQEGQKIYREKGMQRSVVILDNPGTTLQFKRLAKETGIKKRERYIDASTVEDWLVKGLNWIKHAEEPDRPE